MIRGVTDAGAAPALERLMQFAGGRQRILAHSIANLDTPGFVPRDVDPKAFQAQLGRAIDERRQGTGLGRTGRGPLPLESTRTVGVTETSLTLRPEPVHDNVLFHDRNDRDLDRLMQDVAENLMTFRAAADLLRSRYSLMRTAISERA